MEYIFYFILALIAWGIYQFFSPPKDLKKSKDKYVKDLFDDYEGD